MHEASIAQSILDIVLETALKNGARTVRVVNLLVGKISAVDNSALTTAFDVIKEGTIADSAILNIENIPIVGKCNDCGNLDEYEEYFFQCKKCRSFNVELISGEELSIKDIEVD
ncbi:MAG: hydrogenase maturation nickel metallochaperone HypA [Calditerrivibrio sp.]|nr:hydrogenase maturation nickel metallochaperone HypA [Calditerrivibrio sp.]MCA1932798.1 hydrogenase maturation nickel metallochaperone HypA [Calditerrivibrio sp.]MCA1980951.1 hydrogenase maturation nickel metallochaperone HypA [Calditerrivibrio sp.]